MVDAIIAWAVGAPLEFVAVLCAGAVAMNATTP